MEAGGVAKSELAGLLAGVNDLEARDEMPSLKFRMPRADEQVARPFLAHRARLLLVVFPTLRSLSRPLIPRNIIKAARCELRCTSDVFFMVALPAEHR